MSDNIFWHRTSVTREDRERMNGHRAGVVWFTGLSGAGKSTLAHAVEARLHALGGRTYVFDGDNVRHGLCSDLGFSASDRHENMRRIGELVRLFDDAGVIALAAFISPYRADRERIRDQVGTDRFVEVYCRCGIDVCEARDRKGVYRRARAGEIREFTGISAPYEEPLAPALVLDTGAAPLDECVERVLDTIREKGMLPTERDADR
jgi:adenylylsulfate kinase